MRRLSWVAALAASLLPCAAWALPTLASLWPNADGSRWDFQMSFQDSAGTSTKAGTLQLSGTAETAGGTAQVLLATEGAVPKPGTTAGFEPFLKCLWRARPDLRSGIEARYGKPDFSSSDDWSPLLLQGGYFMKSATNIQMWQEGSGHPTWTYLKDDLTVGATFTQQLVPELSDNVFLHGTVESNDANVVTVARSFEHAVRIRYVIDYGWSNVTDPNGDLVGQFRTETRGHVHYVPDVGPVEMLEDFVPIAEVNCGSNACPPAWTDQLGVSVATIALSRTQTPTAIASRSWGQIKSLYE